MSERWCKVCKGWHDLEQPWPHNCLPERNFNRASGIPIPQFARTSLDDVWNPVNGKRYTCARAFERDVKASGSEIIGNDSSLRNAKPKTPETPKGLGEDLKQAWDMLS